MKRKIIITTALLCGTVMYFTSCYKNKADITPPDYTVSFTNDIVPIFTSGPCGCHNTVNYAASLGSNSAVRFSNGHYKNVDTVLYDVILSKSGLMATWAAGTTKHPGGGDVFLTPLEAQLITNWIAQGATDDRSSGGTVNANPTYTKDIAPIVSTTCAGGSCHPNLGPALTYGKLTGDVGSLTTMMASKGASGHPGGKISLSSSVCATFQNWIKNGTPQ